MKRSNRLLWVAGAPALLLTLALSTACCIPSIPVNRGPGRHVPRVSVPFVENRGQWDSRAAYSAQTLFGAVFVTQDGRLVYSLPRGESAGWTLVETFVSGTLRPTAGTPSAACFSDFRGSDPMRWQSGLPSYEEVELGEVWPGVRVSLRARGDSVEKIFALESGIRADRIRLRVDGASRLRIDSDGALVAATGNGDVRFTTPEAYQETAGERHSVDVAYVVRGARYGFRLGAHDPELPVVIDPLLQSTYMGSGGEDGALSVAIDPNSGEVLVAALTSSTDFPGTAGGGQPEHGGGSYDTLVARFDAELTTLLQATYLGGAGDDGPFGIALHPTSGEVLVAGLTNSTDFPATAGGAQPTLGGGTDGFVARLNPSLTVLLGTTYLGGGDEDAPSGRLGVHPTSGEILVAGYTSSTDFPGTAGGAQPAYAGGFSDAFVVRMDATLATFLGATYLGGGEGDDIFGGVAVDPANGEVLVAGATRSTDFPGTTGGAQPAHGGGFGDGFVARLDSGLTALLQATYLGGAGSETTNGTAIHSASGEVLVLGDTYSTDFPGTTGGAQPAYAGGNADGFLARLDGALTTLLQSTYLGGSAGENTARGIAVHPTSGEVIVAGYTYSSDFPGTEGGAQPDYAGGVGGFGAGDGFIARLDTGLTTLLQATYLGGGGNDGPFGLTLHPASGEVLVAGLTYSTDLPAAAGGAQPAFGGGEFDGFVARLSPDLRALLAPGGLAVDPLPNPGDGNHILEPDETVPVAPAWHNLSGTTYTPNGQASAFEGPPGPTYTIGNGEVSYSAIPPGGVGIPEEGYLVSVSLPSGRPVTHLDAILTETLDVPTVLPKKWTLHVGDSFPDVQRGDIFYAFIENLLHNGITGGCGGGSYCPDSSVTRAQMAVFLLKAKHGASYIPPFCLGVFPDVACPGPFTDWIERLAAEGVTAGCGGGNYCPEASVTRKQMAVFLLKAKEGSGYTPPAATGIFDDVPAGDAFAPWIEELYNRQITGGCQAAPLLYCPDNPNTRGQMAVFLVKSFGFVIYGP